MSNPEQSNFFTVNKGEVSKEYTVLTPAEEELLKRKNQTTEVHQENYKGTSPGKAVEIMGVDFFGFNAIEKAFGIQLEQCDIPAIPFSEAELERAKELGQFLILRVNQTAGGQQLTMENMNQMLADEFKMIGKGKIFFNDDGSGNIDDDAWYKNEDFFLEETPKLAWALVTKEIIPDSTRKNYLEQTEIIATYIKDSVFKDIIMPPEFADAIDEFDKAKDEIAKFITKGNWQKAAELLEGLAITKLTRQAPVEVLYDILVYFQNTGNRLREKTYTWTRRRSSGGGFVIVGGAVGGGVGVDAYGSGDRGGSLGVFLVPQSLNL